MSLRRFIVNNKDGDFDCLKDGEFCLIRVHITLANAEFS